jgi:murein DD-endopeptidase MepM/ murein hydrolase activator NlpD
MGRKFTIASTAVVTAILTSAFWVFAYNIALAPGSSVTPAGDVTTVKTDEGRVAVAEGVVVGPAGLAIPVVGVKPGELVDTFSQARAGGVRVHDAIDIMAPRGRNVVAAAPGRVEKIFFSRGGGGNSVYVRSDDGRWIYYYAHLDAYAPGLREGQRVLRGTPIGSVGSTGNANPEGPHLHFAINRMNPGEKWYQGSAVNPYPLLAGKRASG